MTFKCFKCQAEIAFGDAVSKSGKKIPLEVKTNQPHKCVESNTQLTLEDRVSKLEKIVLELRH